MRSAGPAPARDDVGAVTGGAGRGATLLALLSGHDHPVKAPGALVVRPIGPDEWELPPHALTGRSVTATGARARAS